MNFSYFNTTISTGPELNRFEAKAKSQEQRILKWLEINPCRMTPSEIRYQVFGNDVPITSVRRALSNLTRDHRLVKTCKQVKGPYGRPEFMWRLPGNVQQTLF